MAQTNPRVTRVVPDDTIGFYLGMVLFSVLIPALFYVAYVLSPLEAGATSPPTRTPPAAAPEAAPAP